MRPTTFTALVSLLAATLNEVEADPATTIITSWIPRNVCPASTASESHEAQATPAAVDHPVLEPVVHWDHDLEDEGHLMPSLTGLLYYSEGGSNGNNQ